jgi:tetratricopeptide (TPR) repeat protein
MSRILTRQGSFVESGIFISRALDIAPQEPGNYFIRAENEILSITSPSDLLADIYPPRFSAIGSSEIRTLDKYVSDRRHPYYYKTLTEKFFRDYRSFELDEYFMLYYGQTLSEKYAPYSGNDREIADSLHSMLSREQYAEAAGLGSEWLEKNPSVISIYYRTGMSYLNAGNYPKAEEYFHKYHGFITSIIATGNGLSPESAYIVISTSEEYTVMDYLGYKVSGQLLTEQDDNYFDILTGITPSGEEKQVYFNIDKPFGSLGKSLR